MDLGAQPRSIISKGWLMSVAVMKRDDFEPGFWNNQVLMLEELSWRSWVSIGFGLADWREPIANNHLEARCTGARSSSNLRRNYMLNP